MPDNSKVVPREGAAEESDRIPAARPVGAAPPVREPMLDALPLKLRTARARPNPRRRFPPLLELVFIAVAVVAARLWFLAYTHVTYEDALISLRYARNLAEGLGLVYNPGERVFGASTPLHVLLLAGLWALHLPDPLYAAKLLAIAADGVTAAIWYRLIYQETRSRAGAVAFAAAFGLSPFIVEITASGMETPLVLLCLTLAFEAVYSRRGAVLGLWLGLLLLLRLDAVIFVAILLADRAYRQRRFPWRDTALMVAIIAPWFLFSWIYYSSLIPNSIPAKMNAYNVHMHSMSRPFWYTVSRFSPLRKGAMATLAAIRSGSRATVFTLMYLPLFLWGAVDTVRHRRPMGLVLLFFLAQWAFLVLPRTLIFPWYVPPLLLPYDVIGGVGMAALLRWHATTPTRPALRRAFCAVTVGGLALHAGHWLVTSAPRRWAIQSYEESVRQPIGLWLKQHTPPDALISMEPIGYIGYYSQRRILDEVGLVSPGVIPFNRRGAGWFTAVVKRYRPDYIVERPHFLMANKTLNTEVPMFASPAERDWFWKNYRRVQEFACSDHNYRGVYTFMILKRRETTGGRPQTADVRQPPAVRRRKLSAGV
jgi:hypothetical protein